MNKSLARLMALLMFPLMGWADADVDASQLWERLQAIDSLSADFTQEVYAADNTLVQESQGHLSVRKPGLMHWQATSPYQETVVIDGQHIWFYDVDLGQVTVRDFHEDLRQLPALVFTSDKAALAASFEVRKIDSHSFELKPHDTSHYVHKLTLRWNGSLPAALIIEDNLANRTRLQFFSVHINTVVDNSQFQFILPDSADLIDQTGQARP